MQKIILYYRFTPLKDPGAIKLWQQTLASSLNLRGRIIIADHGINGTLGGDIDDLKAYIKQTKTYAPFKSIGFKWSEGAREDFPRLSVKLRPELVTFGVADKLKVNPKGLVGAGRHLSPNALHQLISQKGSQVVLVDGRNAREAAIGKFKDAVVTGANHTRDFPAEITKSKYDTLKAKTIVTYCTGGIRCEVLSKLMLDAGFSDVYQLDGGIVKYLDEYGDKGLWEGSLFVFDKRMSLRASHQAKTIGRCVHCQSETANYVNCANLSCNELILVCESCIDTKTYCPSCIKLGLLKYGDGSSVPAKIKAR